MFHRFGLDAARLQASYYCVLLLLVDHLFSALFILVFFHIAQSISTITEDKRDSELDMIPVRLLFDTCDDGIMPRLAVVLQCFCQVVGSVCMHMYLALLMALYARVIASTRSPTSTTLQVLYR